MMDKAERILKHVFGYDEFRPLQADIIKNVLQKNDTLVIMPTGVGNPSAINFRPSSLTD